MLRLYSYIKTFGNYTKSEVIRLNEEQKIFVNNDVKNLSYLVRPNDIVIVDGNIIKEKAYRYFLYNKPIGLICTNDLNNPDGIIKHLNLDDKYFTVGRLDKLTHGLIIITNDGKFFNKIMNKDNQISKLYEVKLKNDITDEFIKKMESSIEIKNKQTIPAKVNVVSSRLIEVELFEGRYHQIRKLVANANNKILDLKRIKIGNIHLANIREDELIEFKPQSYFDFI